jgi:hypothetical protein
LLLLLLCVPEKVAHTLLPAFLDEVIRDGAEPALDRGRNLGNVPPRVCAELGEPVPLLVGQAMHATVLDPLLDLIKPRLDPLSQRRGGASVEVRQGLIAV